VAIALLALAALAWILARGQRLGGADPPAPPPPSPRSAYLDALAATLERGGDPDAIAALIEAADQREHEFEKMPVR
jgi:hypothetical protein